MATRSPRTLPLAALNVLIVEDNYPMRVLLRGMLSAAGVEHLRDAGDGREAIALLRAAAPDLVLLDYSIPGLNGLEVARSIRADAALSALQVRIIMVTGYGEQSHVDAALAAGVDGFLTKPFRASALLQRINTLFTPPPASHPSEIIDIEDIQPEMAKPLLSSSGIGARAIQCNV